MEFNEYLFDYNPELDAGRPIKFKLEREYDNWYYAYWKFTDEEIKLKEIYESNKGFFDRIFNIFRCRKVTRNCNIWHKLWCFIPPICVEHPESDGWMQTSWEFHEDSAVKMQLNYLNNNYGNIDKLHKWVMEEIGESKAFLKWKDDVRRQHNSMRDSYE